MQYFSEIYSKYYYAVAQVLRQASIGEISTRQINEIIADTAFTESGLYITPRLTDGTWPLLHEHDGMYRSAVNALPQPLTALQRAWLRSILDDKRCCAFLREDERRDIIAALDTLPLYDNGLTGSTDACSDADDYSSPQYAAIFRQILQAIHERRVLHITYTGARGNEIKGDYLPCRLEYSPKDEKFRLLALRIRRGEVIFSATINLARIDRIGMSAEKPELEPDYDDYITPSLADEPAVVEITDERNALERFMVQFANCEKKTRFDEESGKYICELTYRKDDETEILIRLLSYGPVVKVLAPDRLTVMIRQRIIQQSKLFK